MIDTHPDDEAVFWGGTIAKYSSLGVEVHLLVLTNGESGRVAVTQNERGVVGVRVADNKEKEWLSEKRKVELLKSASILGVKEENINFLGLKDGNFDLTAIPVVTEKLKKIDPHVVISFNEAGTTRFSNPDHSLSGIITFNAILSLLGEEYGDLTIGQTTELFRKPTSSFRKYLTYTFPDAGKLLAEWAELSLPSDSLTTVNISEFLNIKREAAWAHKTQQHLIKFFDESGLMKHPETYLERIYIGNSARGSDDIFLGTEDGANNLLINHILLGEEHYNSSDKDFYKTIYERCLLARSVKYKLSFTLPQPKFLLCFRLHCFCRCMFQLLQVL